MANLIVTNTLVEGTKALASDVNQNFGDVRTFVDAQVVHKDGTNPFTVMPILPSALASGVTTAATAANKAYVDDRHFNSAWGVVAAASLDENQVVSGTTELLVTFTAVAGRLYRISGWLRAGGSTTPGGSAVVKLTDGADVQLQQDRYGLIGDNQDRFTFNIVHYLINPSAGSKTYKLRASEASGSSRNWQIIAAADNLAYLVVEDVGSAAVLAP
jgi:hypothetical protein